MNTKIAVAGLAALAVVLGAVAYREPIVNTVASLFAAKPQAASARGGQSAAAAPTAAGGRKSRRGGVGGAVAVTVATAKIRSLPQRLNVIGSVQPVATVGVKARVDGQLYQAFFEEGQMVKKGQQLFRIDPRPFEVTLRQAQANLARDRAQLEKTKSELARYQELMAMGYASRQKFEDVKASNAAMGAVLAANEAAVDQAKLQLDYTNILAPIDGRTGNLLVSVGNLVKANDSNPLVTITQTKPIYVSFAIPESNLAQIKAMMAVKPVQVEATLTGEGAAKQTGTLTFINNVVDVATGTIQLKATFANEDESLTPGAFVNLSLIIRERPEAVVIPTAGLQVGQKGNFVWVARGDDTAEVRPVTVDETTQAYTVIAAGLKAGEKVVTGGQINLIPNGRIRVSGGEGDEGSESGPGADADRPKTAKKGANGDGT